MSRLPSEASAEILREIIRAELGLKDEPFPLNTDLRELPGMESMKVLRIITKIERRFSVEFSDQVVFNVGTLSDLVNALDAAQAETAPGE